MADTTKGRHRHLTLVEGDAPSEPPLRAEPKQHPPGVWDMPAAIGHRRLVGVDNDGNLAIELNVSERLPEAFRREMIQYLEQTFERALRALKI